MPNYKTYKQADSRWGRKNYNGSSTMATAGCGPTSVAMLAYAVNGKTNPWDVAKYMKAHGYAIRNKGTAWSGIPAAMKHFGLQDVKNVSKMADVWSYMAKGYCAVFLFKGGSRGGVRWTSAGHYIAVTGYKYKNKKHYLYTRDSGGRNHTGWYAYETTMKGLIPQIWVGKVPSKEIPTVKKPTGKYSGTIPKPTIKGKAKGDSVKALQRFLNWYHPAWKLAPDGTKGDKTDTALKIFQKTEGLKPDAAYGKASYAKALAYKADPPKPTPKPTPTPTPKPTPAKTGGAKIYAKAKEFAYAYGTKKSVYNYPKGKPKAAYKKGLVTAYGSRKGWGKQTKAGASCDVFAGTCIRCAGVDKKFPRGLDEQIPHIKKSPKFKQIKPKKMSDLKAGDIIIWKKSRKLKHICIYAGGNKVCEAGYSSKRYGCTTKKSNDYFLKPSRYQMLRIYRAK